MSSGFDLRLRLAFTVDELRVATERVLAQVLPGMPAVVLDVVPSFRDFIHGGPTAPRVPEAFLRNSYGASGELGPGFVVMTPDAVAGVAVDALDISFPEDPEGGRSLFVDTSVDRTPVSLLLGAAVAIAAAQLTKNPVRDERTLLTGNRIVDPDEAIDRLRTPAHGAKNFRAMAIPVLRGLGMTTPGWEDWYARAGHDHPPVV
jgi:hypothetical protein